MSGSVSTSGFEVGDRVVDSDPKGAPSAMRAVDVLETRSDEFRIEAIEKTVAAVNDCPADDPVVGVVFEANQNDENATVYHYPASRLEPISEDWEPPAGSSRSSGRQEREQVFGDHSESVEAFIQDARRTFTEPAVVGEGVLDMLAVGPPASGTVLYAESVMADIASPGANRIDPKAKDDNPETRGECQHSRDDSYRPANDEAMCCWECSNRSHNRPEKFAEGDPAGQACSRFGRDPWQLRNTVIKSVDMSGLPENVREAYEGNRRGLLSDIAALRSDDEDDIRRAALRVAYGPHLGDVEKYNHHRAAALLRDHGVDTDALFSGEGRKGGDA